MSGPPKNEGRQTTTQNLSSSSQINTETQVTSSSNTYPFVKTTVSAPHLANQVNYFPTSQQLSGSFSVPSTPSLVYSNPPHTSPELLRRVTSASYCLPPSNQHQQQHYYTHPAQGYAQNPLNNTIPQQFNLNQQQQRMFAIDSQLSFNTFYHSQPQMVATNTASRRYPFYDANSLTSRDLSPSPINVSNTTTITSPIISTSSNPTMMDPLYITTTQNPSEFTDDLYSTGEYINSNMDNTMPVTINWMNASTPMIQNQHHSQQIQNSNTAENISSNYSQSSSVMVPVTASSVNNSLQQSGPRFVDAKPEMDETWYNAAFKAASQQQEQTSQLPSRTQSQPNLQTQRKLDDQTKQEATSTLNQVSTVSVPTTNSNQSEQYYQGTQPQIQVTPSTTQPEEDTSCSHFSGSEHSTPGSQAQSPIPTFTTSVAGYSTITNSPLTSSNFTIQPNTQATFTSYVPNNGYHNSMRSAPTSPNTASSNVPSSSSAAASAAAAATALSVGNSSVDSSRHNSNARTSSCGSSAYTVATSSATPTPTTYTTTSYTDYSNDNKVNRTSSISSNASNSSSISASSPTLTQSSHGGSNSVSSIAIEKKYQCQICGKFFRRDLPRHLRTHQEVARFVCPFPRDDCPHKRGQFNRPYDFKKHLLHGHFVFDDQKLVRSFRDLRSKLGHMGECKCGMRFEAGQWLDHHILGGENRCRLLVIQPNDNLVATRQIIQQQLYQQREQQHQQQHQHQQQQQQQQQLPSTPNQDLVGNSQTAQIQMQQIPTVQTIQASPNSLSHQQMQFQGQISLPPAPPQQQQQQQQLPPQMAPQYMSPQQYNSHLQ